MIKPLLEVSDIHAAHGPLEVLHGVSLAVNEGEIVSLIGGNGAGKSSLLMAISGILKTSAGSISFAGRPISNLDASEIVAGGLSQVPEGRRIFPRLTVKENLDMGAFCSKDPAKKRELLEYCYSLFPVLQERASQSGGTLSGGEQQMLAIARALMGSPKMLLLDEPSMGVAPILTRRIFEGIEQLRASGMTILLVEQNAQLALKLGRRAYVMETGRIVMEGPGPELLEDPKIRAAYLGA